MRALPQDCAKPHCLQHRHPDEHGCTVAAAQQRALQDKLARQNGMLEAASARAADTEKAVLAKKRKRRKKLTGKKLVTAMLVNVMKMKQRAVGDNSVAQDDRVYLNVIYDSGAADPGSKSFYFKSGALVRTSAGQHQRTLSTSGVPPSPPPPVGGWRRWPAGPSHRTLSSQVLPCHCRSIVPCARGLSVAGC